MPANQLLRRHFWVVPLPMIAIAAFFSAQVVTQLVGVGVELDAKQLSEPPLSARRVASPPSTARAKSADPILARNPFDHVTGPLDKPAASEAAASGTASKVDLTTVDPWTAPTCDGVDVQAIAASDDEDWSFAAIKSTSMPKAKLSRRGGEIGGKKIHFIGWDRVWFVGDSDGALCQAQLFDGKKLVTAAPAPAPTTSSSAPAPLRGAKPLDPDLKKGIQAVSATEFNIDRGVVDKILENQADLMRQARIVPEQENGRVVGIRLMGVRSDSLLGTLGMQNGDRLQTINGFEMGSPEKALEAYARLRTADKLTISLNRGGKNMNLDYNIK